MASHHPIRKAVAAAPPAIPDKLYFRIGDVAKLCALPAYVLRFWETEFPNLKPHKGGTGQRLYRKKDVEVALRIKSLLYEQGYTIPGARQVFKSEATRTAPADKPLLVAAPVSTPIPASDNIRPRLLALRAELLELAASLGNTAAPPVPKLRATLTAVPRPTIALKPELVPARSLDLNQGDLFPGS